MSLSQFNIIELSTAIVTIAGGVALILRQVQQSRCRTCRLCCGCVDCVREVPPDPPPEGENPQTKMDEAPDVISSPEATV
jgi:hypothetical protein